MTHEIKCKPSCSCQVTIHELLFIIIVLTGDMFKTEVTAVVRALFKTGKGGEMVWPEKRTPQKASVLTLIRDIASFHPHFSFYLVHMHQSIKVETFLTSTETFSPFSVLNVRMGHAFFCASGLVCKYTEYLHYAMSIFILVSLRAQTVWYFYPLHFDHLLVNAG